MGIGSSAEERFRDVIEFVLANFFEVTSLPVISRLGLRYIDECPIPKKDKRTFKKYYNTTFPLSRFSISQALDMAFATTVKKGKYYLRYIEKLHRQGDMYSLILDFDGFSEKIKPKEYLSVTDDLHALIAKEYETSIKAPVYEYMRKRRRKK